MKRLITFITGLFLLVSINGQILRYSNYVYPPPVTGYCAEFDTVYAAFDTEPHDDTAVYMNAMVNSLDSAGLWDRMDFFYVFSAHDSVDSFINWVHPGTYDITNYNATWDKWQGFTGNGSSAYLETNANFNADAATVNYSQNSATIGVYTRKDLAEDRCVMGVYASGTTAVRLVAESTSGNFWGYINSAQTETTQSNTDSRGLFIMTRRASDVLELYKNPTGEGTENTTASGGVPNYSFAILARHYYTGTPTLFSAQQVSIAFAMDGVTTAEAELIYEIIQRYMTAIGSEV